jgi:hypothetical protein
MSARCLRIESETLHEKLAPALFTLLPRSDGRIGRNWVTDISRLVGFHIEPWVRAVKGTQFATADRIELVTLFQYLDFCLNQVGRRAGPGHLRCARISTVARALVERCIERWIIDEQHVAYSLWHTTSVS